MVHIAGHIPQTGLIGAEQALQGGFTGGIAGLQSGAQQAQDFLTSGFSSQLDFANQSLQRGREGLLGQTTQGIQGLQQALGGAQGFGQEAIDFAVGAQQLGQQGVGRDIGLGIQGLQGFADPGQQAFQSQAALSGALGPQAQQQAFAQFVASPEQQFIEQQGTQGLLRQAAALGGLGGGNIQKDILSFGQGLARQGISDRFNRLGQVSGQGLQAAGQQAGLRGQQAGLNAQLLGQFGLSAIQSKQQQAANQLGVGRDILGARTQLGGQLGQLGATEAQQRLGFAAAPLAQVGNILQQTGQGISDITFGTGQLLAGGRTRAGEQIAGGIGTTASQLAALQAQQGLGLSNILGQGGGNLAEILQAAGAGQGLSQENLAAILANIATGQGSTIAGLPGIPGVQQTQGLIGGVQDLGQAITGITGFLSDKRLKTNIVKIGNTSEGTNLYKWDWTDEGKRLAGDQLTIGVIAQELIDTQPEAVSMGDDGFYRVDYARVH